MSDLVTKSPAYSRKPSLQQIIASLNCSGHTNDYVATCLRSVTRLDHSFEEETLNYDRFPRNLRLNSAPRGHFWILRRGNILFCDGSNPDLPRRDLQLWRTPARCSQIVYNHALQWAQTVDSRQFTPDSTFKDSLHLDMQTTSQRCQRLVKQQLLDNNITYKHAITHTQTVHTSHSLCTWNPHRYIYYNVHRLKCQYLYNDVTQNLISFICKTITLEQLCAQV